MKNHGGFFAWMGGKFRIAHRLAAILPEHSCYVEVFAGAANLLFTKEPGKTEVVNDFNNELINLFRVVKYHPREFILELRDFLHSRQCFLDYKDQPGLTDIQRAARFWFITKTAFGGKGGTGCANFGYGTSGKSKLKRSVFSDVRRCHKRLDGVIIECLDFRDILTRYDRDYTLFFCDPPYLETASYKVEFGEADHADLAGLLAGIKGKFLLTINDHPKIRRLYKGFEVRPYSINYSLMRDQKNKSFGELLIANYPLPKQW